MNYSGMIKYLPAVLLFCSCTESGLLLRERERFAVHFSASGIGMEVTTRASSPLSDNTTLRILAFRRVGQSPDLQADEYMGEGTYRASSGNGSLTPVHSLLLRAGSYDFYALTPETATASGGGGGSGIPGGGGGTTAPPYTVSVGHGMDYATSLTEVEDVRSARRFLKKVDRGIDIDALTFYPLNKHTSPEDISGYLKPLLAGQSMGVISEAGCPAVADPGADVVAIAQRKNLKVVPLVGPSSIIMSVMGSGFNGQSFAFHGYLPIEPGERAKRIKVLEQRVYAEDQTQLFIETPYRNNKMAEDILKNCRPQTKLCIAANITCEGEYIKTKTIKEWQGKLPDLSKIPCIFLIYK